MNESRRFLWSMFVELSDLWETNDDPVNGGDIVDWLSQRWSKLEAALVADGIPQEQIDLNKAISVIGRLAQSIFVEWELYG